MGGQRGLEVSVDVHVFSRVFPHSRCSALSVTFRGVYARWCVCGGVCAGVFAKVALCLRRCLRWCVCGGCADMFAEVFAGVFARRLQGVCGGVCGGVCEFRRRFAGWCEVFAGSRCGCSVMLQRVCAVVNWLECDA